MPTAAPICRDRVALEFSKGIDAERELAERARVRSEAPPSPEMTVLYHEMAAADVRHLAAVERIAIRYGYTPDRSRETGGLGSTLRSLKEKLTDSVARTGPIQHVGEDLAAKANAIHWYIAWREAMKATGDAESAKELDTILGEEVSHKEALQEALNRLVLRDATTGEESAG